MASPWARLWGASSAPADAPPASERIDELRRDVAELREQLAPQLKADIERVTGEGRPFDPAGWVMGVPDSRKYPAGPAFMVRAAAFVWRCGAGMMCGGVRECLLPHVFARAPIARGGAFIAPQARHVRACG